MTKLYGLVALTVGALWFAPARAQTSAEADWLTCMADWADEGVCGARPAPEPPPEQPPPPPPPVEQPPPPPPPVEQPPPPPPPVAQPPPPPPPVEQPPVQPPPPPPPPPPPVVQPPAPPAPDACANGNHSGHSVASSGKANGHRCGGGDDRSGGHGHQDHGRRDYHAQVKSVLKQLSGWCNSLLGRGGRH